MTLRYVTILQWSIFCCRSMLCHIFAFESDFMMDLISHKQMQGFWLEVETFIRFLKPGDCILFQ